ncbi:MAG: DUF87 domain-containing protein [Vicinamibacterales bacterium]
MDVAGVPEPALNQHLAIIGATGSGKTFAAKSLVEHLLRAGRRVCIIDPTGAWWGLRSSADGKGPGFPITIFGGDRADVPITEHAGHALGELIAARNLPAVIDLSGTMLSERHRFVERFAESVFRSNRAPLHLVIDEADEFAPQSGPPGTERMLGAVDRIVRRGRLKGFRVMMITQRPAVLNKNVLTQAATLIALRLPATQDRKAVEGWIKGQADEADAERVLASLARLQLGEGWIWAPHHNVLSRVKFPKISTFDSSRTPEDGEDLEPPATLAEIDLAGVRDAMAAAIAEAEDSDVDTLRQRIRELQAAVAAPTTPIDDSRVRELEESLDHERKAGDALIGIVCDDLGELKETALGVLERIERILDQVTRRTSDERGRAQADRAVAPVDDVPGVRAVQARQPDALPRGLRQAPAGDEEGPVQPDRHGVRGGLRRGDELPGGRDGALAPVGAPHAKILSSIAWWKSILPRGRFPSRDQVAAVAGYTARGGSFKTYVSALSTGGMLVYTADGGLDLTIDGEARAGPVRGPGSLRELHERVKAVLDAPLRKILDVLLPLRGAPLGRTEAAERAGYEASGGSWKTYVSRLSTLGMVVYPKKTSVAAAAWLFPERLR